MTIYQKINSAYHKHRHLFVLVIIFGCMILGWYACSSDRSTDSDKKTGKDSMKLKKDSLDSKVGIEITGKEFQNGDPADPKDTRDHNVIVYKLTNNTDKNIKEIEADVVLNDNVGNEIKKVKITFSGMILKGTSKDYRALYYCNQFSDADMRLKTLDIKDLKFDSNVTMIIYEDGTKEVKK
jgi:hypothetical protein